jgi:thioredoxin reductase (NADPH)
VGALTRSAGPRPTLLAVDVDPVLLDRVEAELQRSFGSDFRVRGERTAEDATRVLEAAHQFGHRVAVVLVDHALAADERSALLARARTLHPDARRALLIPWGAWADRGAASAILTAMAVGDINYYVLKPWIERDELFHRTVAEFVQEWSRSEASNLREVVVIADLRSARGHAIRSMLTRNGIPSAFRQRGSELADAALREIGADTDDSEVLVWMPALGGIVLRDPRSRRRGACRRRSRRTTATSTRSWWAPAPPGSRPRCTPRPRACAPSSSSASHWAGRPAAAR